jgi:hypothetical protein
MLKRTDEQTCRNHENEGEGHFRDEKRAAKFLAGRPGAGTLSTFFQSFHKIFARGTKGGSEAEQQTREQSQGQREHIYAWIEPNFVQPGNIGRAEHLQEINGKFSQNEPEYSP